MGKVIALVGRKGGGGKSTLSVNLAGCMYNYNKDAALINTDPMGSARIWVKKRASSFLPFYEVYKDVREEVKQLSKRHDYLIIDTPGSDSLEMRTAMASADIVIFPFIPSSGDLDVFETYKDVCQLVRKCNKKVLYRAVFNRVSNKSRKLATRCKKELKTRFGITSYHTNIYLREEYYDLLWRNGLSTFDLGVLLDRYFSKHSEDMVAYAEYKKLWGEIIK